MTTAAEHMSKPLTQTVRDFSKSGPMAEGSLVTSSDQLHWSLLHTHMQTVGEHRDKRGGGWERAGNVCRKRSGDVWRLSTPSALSSPAAGTYLMSCFTRRGATGLAFWFSSKLKFSLRTGNHYSIAYRFVLNASLASSVSIPVRPLMSTSAE